MAPRRLARGMTLIDALLGVALIALVFVALAGVFRLALVMVTINKMRAGAIALANERMEVVMGMDYNDIGTIGGIPPGPLAPLETLTLNNATYTRRTLVVYADDPADGVGEEDHNGITTDYKRVKVDVSWQYRDRTFHYAQSAIVVPPGIETSVGGGTLRVKVVDANVAPLPGALVRVENASVDPPVATEMFTNPDGEVIFGGAPAASDYNVTVSKEGYSTDGTLAPSAEIPTPAQPPLSVEEGRTTSASFAIDRLATLELRTFRAPTTTAFTDPLDDTSHLASIDHLQLGEGTLRLVDGAATGTATTSPVEPSPLAQWMELSWFASSSPVRVQVWRKEGDTFTLVPEAELPGNAAGFTASPIDLTALATTTNRALVIRFDFSRAGDGTSPELAWWRVRYRLGPDPVGGVVVHATSSKILGYDAANKPVPKHTLATTTDSSGYRRVPEVEWDAYTVGVDGWRIADVCPTLPVNVAPGSTTALDLFLAEDMGAGSVRVVVTNESGAFVEGASATLTRDTWSATRETSTCGNAYFGDLSPGTYTLVVRKPGFTDATQEVSVDGEEVVAVTLLAAP